MNIPDYITPVVGWRVWRIVDSGEDGNRLQSVVYSHTRWQPGERLEAKCTLAAHTAHDVPSGSGTSPLLRHQPACGIYAVKQPGLLERHLGSTLSPPVAFGLVHLWGRIVEHKHGWRAQYAYPARIFLPGDVWDCRRGLDAYGVPVELVRGTRREALLAAYGAAG